MRFWITKNGELPVRDQLVNQIMLGVLSEDLRAGAKLPSVRALARRHRVHANTVSGAYHELVERGWLELRRGSGLYVSAAPPSDNPGAELDRLLAALLKAAKSLGYEAADIVQRLEMSIRPQTYERILVAEPDAAMFEILCREISDHCGIAVEAVHAASANFEGGLVVALPSRTAKVRAWLPPGIQCLPLRLRSVQGALEEERHPGARTIVFVVSRSHEIRYWSRAMFIAVGLDPDCLCEVDATQEGWRDRLPANALGVCDAAIATQLPGHSRMKVFRVIADSSIDELRQLLKGPGHCE
jgi:DNA-binding transcriptional regulator YhcF (GntR family)